MSLIDFNNTTPAEFLYTNNGKKHEYHFEFGILLYKIILFNAGRQDKHKGTDYVVSVGVSRLDVIEYDYNLYVKTGEYVKFFATLKSIIKDFTERIEGCEIIKYDLSLVSGLKNTIKTKQIAQKIFNKWGYTVIDTCNDYFIVKP